MISRLVKFSVALLLFLTMANTSGVTQSGDSVAARVAELKSTINKGVNAGQKELLIQAKEGLEELSGQRQHTMLVTYYLAYANYRLSSLFEDMPKDQKNRYLDTAISHLEKVTEMAPNFAEGWALLGNCYGMKASGMFSAMRYGPKSQDAIDKALELAEDNPRVEMINGIGLMYKPALFGGSNQKAIAAFKEAGRYYQQWQPESELHPDWGFAENYAWLAQAYLKEDQPQEAMEAYNQALKIDPDYYWVKEILLPELKEETE